MILIRNGRRGTIPLRRRGGRREADGVVPFRSSGSAEANYMTAEPSFLPGLRSGRRRSKRAERRPRSAVANLVVFELEEATVRSALE